MRFPCVSRPFLELLTGLPPVPQCKIREERKQRYLSALRRLELTEELLSLKRVSAMGKSELNVEKKRIKAELKRYDTDWKKQPGASKAESGSKRFGKEVRSISKPSFVDFLIDFPWRSMGFAWISYSFFEVSGAAEPLAEGGHETSLLVLQTTEDPARERRRGGSRRKQPKIAWALDFELFPPSFHVFSNVFCLCDPILAIFSRPRGLPRALRLPLVQTKTATTTCPGALRLGRSSRLEARRLVAVRQEVVEGEGGAADQPAGGAGRGL